MLLANFDRKEHLQHRAVSLRQHGFLVDFGTNVKRVYTFLLVINSNFSSILQRFGDMAA